MKTVLKIFRNDIRSLSRHFFASAVIIGVAFLPALYAWVNIYANGNPYANTGNISIALASRDPGVTLEDGTYVNTADEIIDGQRESDKIDWQFPDDADEAIEGVRSGKYYAAVVFEDNFTFNMYNFEKAVTDKDAALTYYENGRKNAVASKICQTASSNLQEAIKTKYLETVFGIIFDETNAAADELSDGDTADSAIARLENLRDTLRSYDSAISAFTDSSTDARAGLAGAGSRLARTRTTAHQTAISANAKLKQARASAELLEKAVKLRQSGIKTEISALKELIEKLRSSGLTDEEREALEEEAGEKADDLKADLEDFAALFPDSGASAVTLAVRSALESMISATENIKNTVSDAKTSAALMAALSRENLNSLDESITSMIKTLNATLDQLEPLAKSMSGMLDDIEPVLENADDAIASLDKTLLQMQNIFRSSADNIDNIIDKVKSADKDDQLEMLVSLLGGDPEQYAEFFSSLVEVETNEIYSVASYGAAMAPFYSVLAIWVGGVILVSILKTHVDRKKYPGISEAQAFFGRYMLFWIIGQLQAAIIVAGDIILLGCSPVHPGYMFLAASVASTVFVMLIYALTLSFGDIGKAMVVVVMVLQIAGSSGSYPIEILPPVFSKIYKFFPFPYAINAVREALSGMYRNDYFIYLAQLLVFGALAMAIGLLVRKPFIGMNDFVSEKLEKTEVL